MTYMRMREKGGDVAFVGEEEFADVSRMDNASWP